MLDLIRWTTMATAKKKKKYENIAQGSWKWEEEEQETANWEARNQMNRRIQTAEEPLSKPNNCLSEYIICSAETKWCRQSKQCLYRLGKTSTRCPAKLGCSVLRNELLISTTFSSCSGAGPPRGSLVCAYTPALISQKIMLVHRPFEEILAIVAAVMIAWWHFLSQIH